MKQKLVFSICLCGSVAYAMYQPLDLIEMRQKIGRLTLPQLKLPHVKVSLPSFDLSPWKRAVQTRVSTPWYQPIQSWFVSKAPVLGSSDLAQKALAHQIVKKWDVAPYVEKRIQTNIEERFANTPLRYIPEKKRSAWAKQLARGQNPQVPFNVFDRFKVAQEVEKQVNAQIPGDIGWYVDEYLPVGLATRLKPWVVQRATPFVTGHVLPTVRKEFKKQDVATPVREQWLKELAPKK